MAPSSLLLHAHAARVRVKICGLSSTETVAAALSAGADLIGFVSYPPSPRHVAMAEAANLAEPARGLAAVVLLLVDPDDSALAAAVNLLGPDVIQLHGSETPDRVREIRGLFERPVLKAVRVATRDDVEAAFAFRNAADLILFDAKPPLRPEALPGGNGLAFDWSLLDGIAARMPFMLSGGLNPTNVASAIAATAAPFVDVSSGVESAPGRKDPKLIHDFVAAVRAA